MLVLRGTNAFLVSELENGKCFHLINREDAGSLSHIKIETVKTEAYLLEAIGSEDDLKNVLIVSIFHLFMKMDFFSFSIPCSSSSIISQNLSWLASIGFIRERYAFTIYKHDFFPF